MPKGLMSTLRWVKSGTASVAAFAPLPPVFPSADVLSREIEALGLPEVPPEHAKTAVDEAIYKNRVPRGQAMWHMEAGDRAMTEAEWGVFRLGLAELVAHIEGDLIDETDSAQTGVKVFDRLTVEQKLALLADVADAMHNADVPMMDLTAASEGAVAAVLVVARALLREEIAENGRTTMRSLLLAVAEKKDFDNADVPRLKSRKWDDWDFRVSS